MNLFFGLIALIFSVIISVFLSRKYVDRSNYYNSFYNFNKSLKNEVAFTHKTILGVVNSNIKSNDYFYKRLKAKFIDKEILKEKPSFITKEEIEYLDNYLEVIGGSDVKTQLSILDKTEETLSDNLNKSKLDEKRYKSLYIKIGVLIGLLLFVLII